eukprot:CAMPEP_0170554330 /NCGR_PEP_ID=MMETSP0211-20121228/12175_1 /TAXON_ID=311385 /ORGANISM="Pseudokeronopsis sp., Strain OXSARD2" /LENGTH=37 /DNA_ID= /DNA_START= /DNA_END= /DNA_ORIENTATION=
MGLESYNSVPMQKGPQPKIQNKKLQQFINCKKKESER